MQGKHLIIIEATTSGAGLNILESALHLGLTVSFLSANPIKYQRFDRSGLLNRIYQVIQVDTTNREHMQKKIDLLQKKQPIDGLICLTDGHIEIASEIASSLGLPFLSPSAVSWARNKERTRQLCLERGICSPRFCIVENIEAAREVAEQWTYPCILKSSRGTGSSQVQICRDERELGEAFLALQPKAQLVGGCLLLEEFLRGPLYSVEALTFAGQTSILGITDRLLGTLPYFVEVAYSFPVSLDDHTEQKMINMVIDLLKSMGVDHGVTHTELILTPSGPAIVEVNPRLGGGMLGPMISKSYGIDLYEQIIRMAFGLPPEIPEVPIGGASTSVVYPTTAGHVRRVHDEIACTCPGVVDVVISVQLGDYIRPPEDFRGDIGFVWATGNTVDMATSFCRAAAGVIWIEMV